MSQVYTTFFTSYKVCSRDAIYLVSLCKELQVIFQSFPFVYAELRDIAFHSQMLDGEEFSVVVGKLHVFCIRKTPLSRTYFSNSAASSYSLVRSGLGKEFIISLTLFARLREHHLPRNCFARILIIPASIIIFSLFLIGLYLIATLSVEYCSVPFDIVYTRLQV